MSIEIKVEATRKCCQEQDWKPYRGWDKGVAVVDYLGDLVVFCPHCGQLGMRRPSGGKVLKRRLWNAGGIENEWREHAKKVGTD